MIFKVVRIVLAGLGVFLVIAGIIVGPGLLYQRIWLGGVAALLGGGVGIWLIRVGNSGSWSGSSPK